MKRLPLLALALLVACGDNPVAVEDEIANRPHLIVTRGMSVIPDQYDFGEVHVGDCASMTIEITNLWWGNLSIGSVTILGDGPFTLVNPPPPGTVVPPGSHLNMGAEFCPMAEGLATGPVAVQWSNGEAGTSYVELSGTGIFVGPTTPAEYVDWLITEIETLRAGGELTWGQAGLLLVSLRAADRQIRRGWDRLAALSLRGFVATVGWYQSMGLLEAEMAQMLTENAQAAIGLLLAE